MDASSFKDPAIHSFHTPHIPDVIDAEWTWSPGSEGLSPLTLAPHIQTLLGSELVGKDGAKVPVEALAGRIVGG